MMEITRENFIINKETIPALLLVEDDEIDTESFMRALKKSRIPNALYCASDGVEAMDYLHGENGKQKLVQPCVIFLDINMPRMNGFELLEVIRANGDLKNNIVFMLTTSARTKDIELAYNFNVAGYIVKSNLLDMTELLQKYLGCNEFPN
ncbi:MAG: response regulator [Pseudobdellovibrionaceae bacterium]